MKKIILAIQERLVAEVPELRYIDKNWGQLEYDQPPVQFPCALIDVDNINFSQLGQGWQQAEADIVITVCGLQLIRSSAQAPNHENSYEVLDILDKMFQKLQIWSNGKFTPLMRTNQRKAVSNSSYEVYTTSFKTAFTVEKQENNFIEVENVKPVFVTLGVDLL
jgi:hypothetical protein